MLERSWVLLVVLVRASLGIYSGMAKDLIRIPSFTSILQYQDSYIFMSIIDDVLETNTCTA